MGLASCLCVAVYRNYAGACAGLQSTGGILEVLSNYSVVIQPLRNLIAHKHSD